MPQQLNASLALTKGVSLTPRRFTSEDNTPRFQVIADCTPGAGYQNAYDRWKTTLNALPGCTLDATFTVDGRLVTGIGAPNVLENAVAIDRIWGTPIIPGSSLKGLASHYLRAAVDGGITEDHLADLFGTTEWAAAVHWHDAWFDPDSHEHPFAPDVLTPHHPKTTADPKVPPTDFDDPNPVPFVSVRGGFLVAVRAPERAWAEAAMELLGNALVHWGAGAKTTAGYGRMTRAAWVSPWKTQGDEPDAVDVEETGIAATETSEVEAVDEPPAPEVSPLESLLAEIESTAPSDFNLFTNNWYTRCKSDLSSVADQLRVATRMIERLQNEKASEYKRIMKGNWGPKLKAFVDAGGKEPLP